jgi:hypothetical protein
VRGAGKGSLPSAAGVRAESSSGYKMGSGGGWGIVAGGREAQALGGKSTLGAGAHGVRVRPGHVRMDPEPSSWAALLEQASTNARVLARLTVVLLVPLGPSPPVCAACVLPASALHSAPTTLARPSVAAKAAPVAPETLRLRGGGKRALLCWLSRACFAHASSVRLGEHGRRRGLRHTRVHAPHRRTLLPQASTGHQRK